MRLILGRHGNTFEPQDPVVWTGATNDLPLASKGWEQADRLARALAERSISLTAIYSSSLKRTRDYAGRVAERVSFHDPLLVDARLHEVDYGEWTGLTQEQVAERFGAVDQEAWNEHSVWPRNGGWKNTEKEVMSDAQSFAQDLSRKYATHDNLLVISSNGKLRYFLSLIEGEWEARKRQGAFKVKTGHVCDLRFDNGRWMLAAWDISPDKLG